MGSKMYMRGGCCLLCFHLPTRDTFQATRLLSSSRNSLQTLWCPKRVLNSAQQSRCQHCCQHCLKALRRIQSQWCSCGSCRACGTDTVARTSRAAAGLWISQKTVEWDGGPFCRGASKNHWIQCVVIHREQFRWIRCGCTPEVLFRFCQSNLA